ncbi:MAG TPA: Smr/MutS family protein, partial [Myxococcota bacterium]|nr:Smr/MutS family protein [Myxococcota bacterium]
KAARVEAARPARRPALDEAVRVPGNTVDLRGMRVEEGLELVDLMIGEAPSRELDTLFILHGHGTGAMKDAVRRFLATNKRVAAWAPASAVQGGDAFSVVQVG